MCKVGMSKKRPSSQMQKTTTKSGVICLGICCLDALRAWDQGLNALFFEILPIPRAIYLWTRIWRGIKIKPFLISMSKKHFPTRLYYLSVPCHILSTCQVENIVGNFFFFFAKYNSVLGNYFLYQPWLFSHILECSIGVQGIPTMVFWVTESTVNKNYRYITKAPGTGIVSTCFSCRCLI